MRTSELLKIELVAEETNTVLDQSIDEKETALSEREVLDKQNLDLEDRNGNLIQRLMETAEEANQEAKDLNEQVLDLENRNGNLIQGLKETSE